MLIFIYLLMITYNGIIVFICTDAWAPFCIFLQVSGQNESVQLKPIGSLFPPYCTGKRVMRSQMTGRLSSFWPKIKFYNNQWQRLIAG